MTTPVGPKLMTVDEFTRLTDESRYELVRGEIIQMAPPGAQHGDLASRIDRRLGTYVEEHALGKVLVETGYILAENPDTVRAPDISFLRRERIPAEGLPRGFIAGSPNLAIEIVSPSDTAEVIDEKVHDYLSHETSLVWVVQLRTRSVAVYRSNGTVSVLRAVAGDSLEGEDVVPGFSLPLTELFEL